MITYQDLLTFSRRQLHDVIKPYLWSDEDLLTYSYLTVNTFLTETKLLTKSATYTTTNMDKIILPNHVISIFNVKADGKKLNKQSMNSFIHTEDSREYAVDGNILYIPKADEITFDYYSTLDYSPNEVTLMTEIPIHSGYMSILIDGILAQAFNKQDSDVADLQKSTHYYQSFLNKIILLKHRLKNNSELPERPSFRGLL